MSRRLLSRSKPNFALCYATFFLTLYNESYDDSALMDLFSYLSGACVLVFKGNFFFSLEHTAVSAKLH